MVQLQKLLFAVKQIGVEVEPVVRLVQGAVLTAEHRLDFRISQLLLACLAELGVRNRTVLFDAIAQVKLKSLERLVASLVTHVRAAHMDAHRWDVREQNEQLLFLS